MAAEQIQEGFDVFAHDGAHAFGDVRRVLPHGREIVIYIENAGEFTVPISAVQAVHDEKVVLDTNKLDAVLRSAIRHAHDAEDPTIP